MKVRCSPLVTSLWGSAKGVTIRRFRGQLVAYSPISNDTARLSPADWLTGWARRKRITVSHSYVNATLQDFTLLTAIDTDPDIGQHAQPDGHDLRFTTADKLTLLPHDREHYLRWGPYATASLWVKLPSLSHTQDTVLYLYYDNDAAPDGHDPTHSWDAHYLGIWHLHNHLQNSVTGIAATDTGTVGYTAAVIAKGREGDGGASDRLQTDITPLGPTHSIEAWVKADTLIQAFLGVHDNNNHRIFIGDWQAPGDKFVNGFGDAYNWPTGQNFATAAWYYIALTGDGDGGTAKLYINGVHKPAEDLSYNWTGHNNQLLELLNYARPAEEQPLDGILDEARYSNAARSPAHISLHYNNVANFAAVVTIAAEETAP